MSLETFSYWQDMMAGFNMIAAVSLLFLGGVKKLDELD